MVADVSVALGVGEAVSVGVEVADAVAVGIGDALSSLFELFPFAHTIKPRIIIPTITANITRPEAPGFFSATGRISAMTGVVGGNVEGVDATEMGAGVVTISTRALR